MHGKVDTPDSFIGIGAARIEGKTGIFGRAPGPFSGQPKASARRDGTSAEDAAARTPSAARSTGALDRGLLYNERHMSDLEPILGYLNFSEGRPDPASSGSSTTPTPSSQPAADGAVADCARPWKRPGPAASRRRQGGFQAESAQAEASIRLVFDEVLPAYRDHHADLLFHLDDADFHNRSSWRASSRRC